MNSAEQGWTIVGVDCATDPKRIGLANGLLSSDGKLGISRVMSGSACDSPAAAIVRWIGGRRHFLIAMDAPLGWPAPLADALPRHRAGQPLQEEADQLFRRATDRFVHEKLKKRPLEVGADRIARTARSALSLLQSVREISKQPISMVWSPGEKSGVIEVYPAATLLGRAISTKDYKKKEAVKARHEILVRLRDEIDTRAMSPEETERINGSDDLLDSLVCVLAGADFLRGDALHPSDVARAKREGWIWFRGPGESPAASAVRE